MRLLNAIQPQGNADKYQPLILMNFTAYKLLIRMLGMMGVAALCWLLITPNLYAADKNDKTPEIIKHAISQNRSGNYLEAITAFEEANASLPLSFEERSKNNMGIAFAFQQLGRNFEALEAVKHAIELTPDFIWAYQKRCWIYLELGDYRNAKRDCGRALQYDPNEALFYDTQAEIHFRMGQYELAKKNFKKSLELKQNSTTYFNLANLEALENNTEIAMNLFSNALVQEERERAEYRTRESEILRSNILTRRAKLYVKLGQYNLAVNDFEAALEFNTSNLEAALSACQLGALTEASNATSEICDDALNLSHNNPQALFSKGLVQHKAKNYSEAIRLLNRSIEQRPDTGLYYYQRSLSHELSGDTESAKQDYAKAKKLSPDIEELDGRNTNRKIDLTLENKAPR